MQRRQRLPPQRTPTIGTTVRVARRKTPTKPRSKLGRHRQTRNRNSTGCCGVSTGDRRRAESRANVVQLGHPQNEALLPWFEFQANSSAIDNAYSYPNENVLTQLSAPQPFN